MRLAPLRSGVLAAGLLAAVLIPLAPVPARAQAMSQVRAVHAIAGSPAVDITVDGRPAFPALAPRAGSAYASLPAGRHAVRITPAGQAQPVLLEGEVELRPDAQATLALVGAAPTVRLLLLADDNSAPPTSQAKVRFVHGAPDVPIVDVAAAGGVLLDGIGYGAGSGYVVVPAGTYTLRLQAQAGGATLATVPDVTVGAGQIVTLFAIGRAADNTVTAVAIPYAVGGTGTTAAEPGRVLPVQMPATGTGLRADHDPPVAALVLLALFPLLVAAGVAARRVNGHRPPS